MVTNATECGTLIKFFYLKIGQSNTSFFFHSFKWNRDHYEMKLFFQTASFSLDITHYVDSMVIHCFCDPLNFVPKYFQNALIEIVQICPDRGSEEGYKVP